MSMLINTTNPDDWDLILTQEPYCYPNSQLVPASSKWVPIYLAADANNGQRPAPRSILLINANIQTDSYKQICVKTDLITAVTIHTAQGPLDIYNIYNPPGTDSTLTILSTWLTEHPLTTPLL